MNILLNTEAMPGANLSAWIRVTAESVGYEPTAEVCQ